MGEKTELRNLVRQFSAEQYAKLNRKVDLGWLGWDDPGNRDDFKTRLIEHVVKEDWVDVANFAAFLWYLDCRRGDG